MNKENKISKEERAAILKDVLTGKITEADLPKGKTTDKDLIAKRDVVYQMTRIQAGVRVANELGRKFIANSGDATKDLVDIVKQTDEQAAKAHAAKVAEAVAFVSKPKNAKALAATLALFPRLPMKYEEVDGTKQRVLDNEKIPLDEKGRKIVSAILSSVEVQEVGAKRPVKLVNGLANDAYRELFGTKKEPKEVSPELNEVKAAAEDLRARVADIVKAVAKSQEIANMLDTIKRAIAGKPVTSEELSVLHTNASPEAKERAKELGLNPEEKFLKLVPGLKNKYHLTAQGKKFVTYNRDNGARGNRKIAAEILPAPRKTKSAEAPAPAGMEP